MGFLSECMSKGFRSRDFPGSLVVQTFPSNAKDAGSVPGQGAKITHASWPNKQKVKQKQYYGRLDKDF